MQHLQQHRFRSPNCSSRNQIEPTSKQEAAKACIMTGQNSLMIRHTIHKYSIAVKNKFSLLISSEDEGTS